MSGVSQEGALASPSAARPDGCTRSPELPLGQTVFETESRLGDTPATMRLDPDAVEKKDDAAPTPRETNTVAGAGPSRRRPPSRLPCGSSRERPVEFRAREVSGSRAVPARPARLRGEENSARESVTRGARGLSFPEDGKV